MAAADPMVLKVTLNTEDKGDLFVARTPDGDFLVKVADLKAIGFRAPTGVISQFDGEPHLSLRSMARVRYTFQEKGLVLHLTADPQELPERAITLRGERALRGAVPGNNSAFLNYAFDYSRPGGSGASSAGFTAETGWRFGDFLFMTNAATTTTANSGRKFVRLMSSVTHDDRDELRRVVIGDFFTPSREFGTSVNLGGLSISKLYGLDPYLNKSPTQAITGTVALPSDLEVYLDGQRIRSERIQPGQFSVRDILAYGGSRSVQVLLRDSFGRVQELNYSFYFSDQPLQQGLQEYSLNLGAMRRGYGQDNAKYGPLAYSGYYRYGLSNALTAGVSAEGTRKLTSLGASSIWVLGGAGVANLAVARSSFEGRTGTAASVGYSYQSRIWNVGFSLRREWGEFASLGDPVTFTNRQVEANAVLGIHVGRGSLSLSHSLLKVRALQADAGTTLPDSPLTVLQDRRVTALSYTVPLLSDRLSLTTTLSHIKEAGNRNEAYVGLLYFLDKEYSASASFRGDGNSNSQALQFTRNQPIGEGLGYVLSADRGSGPEGAAWLGKSSVQYNAAAAILRGELSSRRTGSVWATDSRLAVTGGVAYVEGDIAFGRPVQESFGIVKVGAVAGVGITVNNQDMGKTNAQGKLFIPTLSPYFDSDVAIVGATLPIDYSIPAVVKRVSPSLRGGAVIDFGATRVQAFNGVLKVRRAGALEPVENEEASLMAAGVSQGFRTARRGDFYLENLKPGRYPATVQSQGSACAFELVIPASDETFVDLGEVICRLAP